MARFRKWRGKEVTQAVARNVAKSLGEFAMTAEGFAKDELRKGHGVVHGTLRRSIHAAQPGYNWVSDNLPGLGEQGGQLVEAAVRRNRITVQLGSGLGYALPVHQGHHSFEGYHYLTIGVDKARPKLPEILKRNQL